MNLQQKTKKNLGRALALLLTIGSLTVITATPAMATFDPDNPSWTLDVTVSDTTCVPDYTAADWAPQETLMTYNNTVDMAAPTTVTFDVSLGFSAGMDMAACGGAEVPPSGNVSAALSLDPELEKVSLDCDTDVTPCAASTLFSNFSTISGSVDVADGTAPGTYSGTLTVVWTPAG